MSIQAVFFDAVGTVIHPDPPAALAYARVGKQFGSKLTPEEIARRFHHAFAAEEAADQAGQLRTSEAREAQRWRTIVARVLDDVADPTGCFDAVYRHFARADAWSHEPDTQAVFPELARRGYRLGLASNYDHRLHTVIAGLPGAATLTHVIISAEVGWRKPAAEFFTALCREAGLPPERILHVGDDRNNDFEGARRAGLQAVLFDPKGRNLDLADQRIERLRDLIEGSRALPWAERPR